MSVRGRTEQQLRNLIPIKLSNEKCFNILWTCKDPNNPTIETLDFKYCNLIK